MQMRPPNPPWLHLTSLRKKRKTLPGKKLSSVTRSPPDSPLISEAKSSIASALPAG